MPKVIEKMETANHITMITPTNNSEENLTKRRTSEGLILKKIINMFRNKISFQEESILYDLAPRLKFELDSDSLIIGFKSWHK